MDVSDRRLQVQLTPEAKIASDFSLVRAIFVFAGFVSALECRGQICPRRFRIPARSSNCQNDGRSGAERKNCR